MTTLKSLTGLQPDDRYILDLDDDPPCWANFVDHLREQHDLDHSMFIEHSILRDALKEYNAKIRHPKAFKTYIRFATSRDYVIFELRWG